MNLTAGNQYTQTGSQVLAPQGDVDIAARKVLIDAATNTSTNQSEQHFKQSGLSVSISNPLLNAAQTTAQMASAAGKTNDARMQALAAAAAALSIKDAVNQVAANPGKAGGIDVNVSLGASRSDSTQAQSSTTAVGSRTAAGGNVSIQATAGGAASTLDIAGSDIHAGGTAALKSDGSMTLEAARNTSEQRSRNSSSSGSIGTSFGSSGWSVNASASKGQGKADGTDLTYTNTHVSGAKVELQSGGDTALKGAVVTGQQVTAEVKGNLNIESLQDTSTYAAKQTSAGVGIAVPIGAGNASVSVNASKAKVDGDYASVTEQSGIKAGDGGFQLRVGGNTDLKGGVISSTQAAVGSKTNSLTTAAITASNIQNHDRYEASGVSIGLSLSAAGKGQTTADPANQGKTVKGGFGATPGIAQDSGSQSSTTKSGVSSGEIALTGQGQVPASLDRTVVTGKDSSGALAKNWNGQQLMDQTQAGLQITSTALPRVAQEIGTQMDRTAAELRKQRNEAEAKKYEEGGAYRIAAHASLGALGGGLCGAAGAGAASATAPMLNDLQDSLEHQLIAAGMNDDAAKLSAQIVAGGAATAIGAAIGGSAGAVTAGNTDVNNRQLHPTETQWIAANKKRFAKQQGISEDVAEQRLAKQAFRQVQFGVPGETDQAAQAFLLTNTQGLMLPGDPNAGQSMGYMFRADPSQKANAHMYATEVIKDPNALAFYGRNGLTQPAIQQIQQAASTDANTRNILTNATLGAAGAAAAAHPPALSWCLSNPVSCNHIAIAGGEIAAGDALGPVGVGVVGLAGVKAVRSAEEVNAAMAAKGCSCLVTSDSGD